jgi:GDP-mannose transporter
MNLRARSSSSVTDAGFLEAELAMQEGIPLASSVDRAENGMNGVGGVVEVGGGGGAKPLSRFRVLGLLRSPSLWHCILYSSFSIAMTLVNKIILTTYGFPYPMILLLIQNSTCVVLLWLARQAGVAQFESINLSSLVAWVPLNILFVLMLLTGFWSINLLSVPMSTIFKNSANVLVTVGDYLFYGRSSSPGIKLSLVLMLLGAVMAGRSDLEFNATGYALATLNCFITAAYVLYMPRAIKDSRLNAFGRVYYNNLLSIPLVVVVDAAVFGDMQNMLLASEPSFAGKGSLQLYLFILLSGCIGFFLSHTSFQCVQSTSPTTYSMVGALNKVPLAFLGIVVFHTQINEQGATFILVSLAAGVLFAYSKSVEQQSQK